MTLDAMASPVVAPRPPAVENSTPSTRVRTTSPITWPVVPQKNKSNVNAYAGRARMKQNALHGHGSHAHARARAAQSPTARASATNAPAHLLASTEVLVDVVLVGAVVFGATVVVVVLVRVVVVVVRATNCTGVGARHGANPHVCACHTPPTRRVSRTNRTEAHTHAHKRTPSTQKKPWRRHVRPLLRGPGLLGTTL